MHKVRVIKVCTRSLAQQFGLHMQAAQHFGINALKRCSTHEWYKWELRNDRVKSCEHWDIPIESTTFELRQQLVGNCRSLCNIFGLHYKFRSMRVFINQEIHSNQHENEIALVRNAPYVAHDRLAVTIDKDSKRSFFVSSWFLLSSYHRILV